MSRSKIESATGTLQPTPDSRILRSPCLSTPVPSSRPSPASLAGVAFPNPLGLAEQQLQREVVVQVQRQVARRVGGGGLPLLLQPGVGLLQPAPRLVALAQ